MATSRVNEHPVQVEPNPVRLFFSLSERANILWEANMSNRLAHGDRKETRTRCSVLEGKSPSTRKKSADESPPGRLADVSFRLRDFKSADWYLAAGMGLLFVSRTLVSPSINFWTIFAKEIPWHKPINSVRRRGGKNLSGFYLECESTSPNIFSVITRSGAEFNSQFSRTRRRRVDDTRSRFAWSLEKSNFRGQSWVRAKFSDPGG